MRALLTGSSGLVGSHFLTYLVEHTNWDIVCPCSWRHEGDPLRQQVHSDNPRVTIITHDLKAPLPDLGHFDYIFSIASLSNVDTSIADPLNFVENNISIVLNLLEYARKYPPKLFIQFSTDEVFGHTDIISDVLWPSNPYAASKAAQELLVSAYRKTYRIQAVVTNSNNIIGPTQNPAKYVSMLVKTINAGETVKVHVQEGKIGRRRYNVIWNVCAALLFLVENYVDEPLDGPTPRFGIGGGTELDNLEIAHLVANVLGKELKYEMVDVSTVRPGYDFRYPAVNDRLEKMGFVPPYKFEEGLEWLRST